LEGEGGNIDLGRVGRVTRVDDARLQKLCNAGIIPVLPCLAQDEQGELLNVNADTVAAAVAELLHAEKLVFISDTPGLLRDRHDETSLIRSITAGQCRELIEQGVIEGGMIPKVEACLQSLAAGVGKVHMIDGRTRHSLLLEIYTDRGVGTEIVNDAR
jgi:acetylglutamate kinase